MLLVCRNIMPSLFSIFLCVVSLFMICPGMRIIFERIEIHYVNESYIKNAKTSVRRYSRKGGYYVNLEGDIFHPWGNNVSFDVILFELLHNEYKRTFVEFHFNNLCTFVSHDKYLGMAAKVALKQYNLTCPFPSGHYLLSNMSIAAEEFPYVWPFERAKGTGTFTCNQRKVVMGNGSLYVRFEQKKKVSKRSVEDYGRHGKFPEIIINDI